MQREITLLLLFCLTMFSLQAQIVETLDTSVPKSCDDMFVDQDGVIYTGKGGLSNKTNLGRIMPDGSCSDVAEGMKGPISIVKAPNGLFYVTNYDDNSIKSYDPTTEEVLTVATGLDGPSGIAIDANGIIYATNWGGWPNYNGHQIHRLMPDGTFDVFIDSPLFSRLQGIAIDDEGWLYVANTQNGRVFKINTETAEMDILVTMGENVVNMEYREGYIYMASIQSNRIFRMNLEGEWSTFAGTGIAGGNDGPVETATFNNPIGVGFSPTKDTLYVADAPSRIRRIIFSDPISSVQSSLFNTGEIEAYPNPGRDQVELDLSTLDYKNGFISLIDVTGNVLLKKIAFKEKHTIDISNLPGGSYFAVFSKGSFSTSKLLMVR